MKTTIAIAASLLTSILSGCGGGDDGAPGAPSSVAKDSAGVTIVENRRPEPESRMDWTVGSEPSLSIGSVDSEEPDQLYRVLDATRLSDGRIVVANSGTSELRIFDPSGAHLATWGGFGEGPGEFGGGSPAAVASWRGDSIAASDPRGARLSIFDADGNHGHNVPLGDGLDSFLGLLPDGMIFAKETAGLNPTLTGSTGLARWEEEWAVLGADGAVLASLGTHPGAEWYAVFGLDGNLQGGRPHPFARRSMGSVWGELAVVGVSDSYELKAYRTDGSLARIVRRTGDLGSPSSADLEAFYTRLYATMPDEDRIRALNEVRDMPVTDSYPAFSWILQDLSGCLWVLEYRMPGGGDVPWTVFDPEGRVLGMIETPPGLGVLEIGEDYILGVSYDDLGVEYVQLWPLSREPMTDAQ